MKQSIGCTKGDIYTRITEEIIKAIEAGVEDCVMPWHKKALAGVPKNAVTKNPYHGINTLMLWMVGMKEAYASTSWASYKQWQSIGAQVREGEKGSVVVFYTREEVDENDDRTPRAFMRYSHVFNGDQVDGWQPTDTFKGVDHGTLQEVDRFIDALESDTRYGSDLACYVPSKDCILMPNRAEFYDTKHGSALEGFYAVLLHEHVHWTGHKTRLDRDLSGKFGSQSYALEELVAELGAAYLCASLGISTFPRPDHASYIANWLEVLKQEKKAIFVAAGMASTASQYLEGLAVTNAQPETVYEFNPAE
jgi:antirestriction protein ArdC